MQVFAKTEIGHIRKENQDAVIVKKMNDGAVVAVICDGMGGMSSGGEASELACNEIFNRIATGYRSEANFNSLRNLMLSALNAANAIVYQRSCDSTDTEGMGTTCVASIVKNDVALFVNIGDSRAYLIEGEEVTQITKDHTIVEMLKDQGKITDDEVYMHPHRNIITRAIGIESNLEIDYYEVDLEENAKILLCTDGLSQYCSNECIYSMIKDNTLEEAVKKCIDFALSEGGKDNITVALIGNDQ